MAKVGRDSCGTDDNLYRYSTDRFKPSPQADIHELRAVAAMLKLRLTLGRAHTTDVNPCSDWMKDSARPHQGNLLDKSKITLEDAIWTGCGETS